MVTLYFVITAHGTLRIVVEHAGAWIRFYESVSNSPSLFNAFMSDFLSGGGRLVSFLLSSSFLQKDIIEGFEHTCDDLYLFFTMASIWYIGVCFHPPMLSQFGDLAWSDYMAS